MELLIKDYYATNSIDNISNHIPLFNCLTGSLQNLYMIIMLHSKKILSETLQLIMIYNYTDRNLIENYS